MRNIAAFFFRSFMDDGVVGSRRMAVSINQHQPGSFTVEMTADDDANVPSASWEQYFLLISDAHIDNAHADRAMFDRHMRQCRERGARWFSNGDFLCLLRSCSPRATTQRPSRSGTRRT